MWRVGDSWEPQIFNQLSIIEQMLFKKLNYIASVPVHLKPFPSLYLPSGQPEEGNEIDILMKSI